MRKTLITVAAAAVLFFGLALVAPTASADALPNGYSITCTPNGADGLICNISGCPRVYEQEAGDVVHTMFDHQGNQRELKKSCNNTTTADFGNIGAAPYTISIQGCRKHDFPSTDDCGPWSDYTYTPPPQAAPSPVVSNAGTPMLCTGNNQPSYKLPPGSDCSATPNPNAPPAPVANPVVTNAIQAHFGQPGLSSVDFFVTNTSNLDATCHYTATANGFNPLVPKTTTRQFDVPANGKDHRETFDGAPTLTTYNVTLSCNDASGKQSAELGHVVTSVLW